MADILSPASCLLQISYRLCLQSDIQVNLSGEAASFSTSCGLANGHGEYLAHWVSARGSGSVKQTREVAETWAVHLFANAEYGST